MAALLDLARLFLKLGTLGFGGPAAHIALMEDEVVRRRDWLSRERFLDLLGATNLIPSPNSTEMAIHVGHERAGWRGLVVAGVGAAGVAAATAGVAPFGLGFGALFLVFLKIGSVLFGSGYVLLAFLRADLVVRRGWLTEGQILDAIAVGQVTPGPVFTTATFVGYVLGGFGGAVAATVGIFLPAFVFVALSGPLVPRIRRSPVAGAFLDGVNVASIALMGLVTAQLARAAIVNGWTAGIAVASAALLLRFRASPAWLVPAAALLGLVLPR